MTTVKHILDQKSHDVHCIHPDASVFDALKMMAENNIGSLVVLENGKLVGLITERHYAREIVLKARTSPGTLVRDIMSTKPTCARPDQSVEECMAVMNFSVQLVDFYTFNFGYMGSRTTGNGANCGMIAGPSWKGDTPEGIAKVFQSETDFVFAGFRTQLFNPADIENVRKIQAGYRAMPLSKFLNKPAPPPAPPEIAWPKIDKKLADSDPFTYLIFVLQFGPAPRLALPSPVATAK